MSLRAAIAQLAQGLCDPAPFEPFLELATAPVVDAGPGHDLLIPGRGLGLNVFDRGRGAPTVLPVLQRWCLDQLGTNWLEQGALDGLRVHGGPAFSGAWRCKLYASGDVRPVWERLHREHGLGVPIPPEGTYALGLDLTQDGPRRLRSYRRVKRAPKGLPEPLHAELGVVHRVWCETHPGPADPETRVKASLSWIFGPRVPATRLAQLASALGASFQLDLEVEAHAVAWEIDVWADGERGTDALVTVCG